jgi:hypothetical protein
MTARLHDSFFVLQSTVDVISHLFFTISLLFSHSNRIRLVAFVVCSHSSRERERDIYLMRSTTAMSTFQRLRILPRIAGAKKKKKPWNPSLAPPSSRCLSSARPLPTEEEISPSDWQEKLKAIKKAYPQSPSSGSFKSEFSTTFQQVEVTDFTENVSHEYVSPNALTYTGDVAMPVTSNLHIVTPEEDTPRGIWPVFRLMVSTMD